MIPTLARLYTVYNARYWDGALPHYRLRRTRLPGVLHGRCDKRHRIIWLDLRKIADGEALGHTVLHEMCHVADPDRKSGVHRERFQAELARLAAQGEAWAEEERQVYADPACLVRADFRTLRAFLDDLTNATEPGTLRWQQVERQAAHYHGVSVRELGQRWPRLRASWRHLQREQVRINALQARLFGGAREGVSAADGLWARRSS